MYILFTYKISEIIIKVETNRDNHKAIEIDKIVSKAFFTFSFFAYYNGFVYILCICSVMFFICIVCICLVRHYKQVHPGVLGRLDSTDGPHFTASFYNSTPSNVIV